MIAGKRNARGDGSPRRGRTDSGGSVASDASGHGTATLRLPVPGTDCPSCVEKVDRSVAGTDAALEPADVALIGDDLTRLPHLYDLSRRTTRVIRRDIRSSLAVKSLLAVGAPLGYVSVIAAVVVGDTGTSPAVTSNALRLMDVRPDPARADRDGAAAAEASTGAAGEATNSPRTPDATHE